MNRPEDPHVERGGNGHTLAHTVIIGGDAEALTWIPRLLRDPQINLVALVPTHPADLVRNLEPHGYALADPCPVPVLARIEELGSLDRLDLMVDTTVDPGVVRALAEAGLADVPRVNPAALGLILERTSVTPATSPPVAVFREHLAKEVARAYRNRRTLGLVTLQLAVVDGQREPDPEVHAHTLRILEQSLRIEDIIVAQPHGSYAILLPETGDATHEVAARLTSNLANLKIREGVVAASVPDPSLGWAWFPQEAKTAPALLARAESRMAQPPRT